MTERRFAAPVPEELNCSIHLGHLEDAVILRGCGHSFCRACLAQTRQRLCPLCRVAYTAGDIVDNELANALVASLPVHCAHAVDGGGDVDPDGCPEVLPLSCVAEHEAACTFRRRRFSLMRRPRDNKGGRCPHAARGCEFRGPPVAVSEHLEACEHQQRVMRDYVARMEAQLQAAQSEKRHKEALEQEQAGRRRTDASLLLAFVGAVQSQVRRILEPPTPQQALARDRARQQTKSDLERRLEELKEANKEKARLRRERLQRS